MDLNKILNLRKIKSLWFSRSFMIKDLSIVFQVIMKRKRLNNTFKQILKLKKMLKKKKIRGHI